jgi:HIT domain
MASPLFFSTIDVTRQVFYRTSLSFAIVNLKPIVPGRERLFESIVTGLNECSTDVLVVPTRPVPRLADLNPPELASLMSSVQHVGRMIERVYGADGLTVACQVDIHIIVWTRPDLTDTMITIWLVTIGRRSGRPISPSCSFPSHPPEATWRLFCREERRYLSCS